MIEVTFKVEVIGGRRKTVERNVLIVPRIGEKVSIDDDPYVVQDVQHIYDDEGTRIWVYVGYTEDCKRILSS